MSDWPKHEDGTNKRIGDMTPDERKAVFKAAAQRVQAEFEHPVTQEKLAAALRGERSH